MWSVGRLTIAGYLRCVKLRALIKETYNMKLLTPYRIVFALLTLAFSAVTAFSQDVTGVWAGRVWQAASGAEFVYAMTLEQRGNTAIGRAVARPAGGGGLGEWDISVTVYSNSIYFKDLSVTGSPSPGSSWCLKEGRLNYDPRNNRIYGMIEGYVQTYGIRTQCASISFDLYKKTDSPKSEQPAPKSEGNYWAGNGTGIVLDSKIVQPLFCKFAAQGNGC
jgi:hypothetical protein